MTSPLAIACCSVLLLLRWVAVDAVSASAALQIDSAKVGRTFDGIGGLSGGGATTRLLVDYKEPQRSQILDYLFKPNYGASLQILKVEIGGDSQSTDGTESSHMHSKDDLDYGRGYEWWLLTEAKKRNPDIKTYGLPWAFPGWIGGPELSGSPFKHPELTSDYILKWLQGARKVYDVEIDYIGIWNERASDATYVKTLRKTLDAAGFPNTTLVARDGDKFICDDMAKDKDYAKAVGVVGMHYPNNLEDYSACRKIGFGQIGRRGGKPIWSSEESSSYDDLNGGACWGRKLTSNWVLQGFTSSIMWNLVGSNFHGTSWYASSMLTAVQPWSGHYDNLAPVWATAHVTQFTRVGWDLIQVGSGSGELPNGGFYATYADPKGDDWTLTVIKISEDHAPCTRPPLPHFNVSREAVTFKIAPSMKARELAVWYSNFEDFRADGSVDHLFQRLPNLAPEGGSFQLDLKVGGFYTVSTILKGPKKGVPATPIPTSQPSVPLPISDDFESYRPSQEAAWWTDQIGAFEVHYEADAASGNKVMRQMVPSLPIGWADPGSNGPMSLLGMREWQDIELSAAFRLPPGAPEWAAGCVATRVDQMWQNGIALCVRASGAYTLSVGGPKLGGSFAGQIYRNGSASALPPGAFSRISLTTLGGAASATLNGAELFAGLPIRELDSGFAAIGANDWFPIAFDDVSIRQVGPRWTPGPPSCAAAAAGTPLSARPCVPNGLLAEHEGFELLADWGIRHVASGLCASAASSAEGQGLVLAACDPADPTQQLRNDYTMVRNAAMPFTLKVGAKNLLLSGSVAQGTVFVSVASQAQGVWQTWAYFPNSRQLRNQYVANTTLGYPMCLAACPTDAQIVV